MSEKRIQRKYGSLEKEIKDLLSFKPLPNKNNIIIGEKKYPFHIFKAPA